MKRRTQTGVALAAACLLLLMAAGPAFAHDPIFVGDDQTTPDTGPFMPDGAISWALYGQVLAEGDTRGFEFDLRAGEEMYISLLIPNLSPELELSDDQLPTLELENPDGTTRTLRADMRTIFDEEFSRTSYVTLLELREPAQAGRYRGTVTGAAAARFTVAIGEREIFFTETERSGDRPSTFLDISAPLQEWYATPPGGEATEIADDVGIDMERIEEAMDSGDGVIAEPTRVPDESAAEPTLVPDEPADVADPADNENERESEDEVASVVIDADGGASNTWVAPVVIGLVAVAGAGVALARRSPRT